MTGIEERLHSRGVEVAALALPVGTVGTRFRGAFVGRNTAPSEGLFYVGFGAVYKPCAVGVFNPQDEGATVSAGEQPVVKGRAYAPHV